MKDKNNIENKFKHLKNAYSVPTNYFNNIEKKMLIEESVNKFSIKKYLPQLTVAASLLLMISIGIMNYNHPVKNNNIVIDSISNYFNITNESNDFEDVSDEEIIEYLANSSDIEDYLE
jgi:hypothetical protein